MARNTRNVCTEVPIKPARLINSTAGDPFAHKRTCTHALANKYTGTLEPSPWLLQSTPKLQMPLLPSCSCNLSTSNPLILGFFFLLAILPPLASEYFSVLHSCFPFSHS